MQTTPASAAVSAATTSPDRSMSALSSEDFFKILVTELKQQDPFQPAKTGDMIGQVSQIRSIELSKQLTDALSKLTCQQHTAGASELLGKYVTARIKDQDGTEREVSGVVTGVRFDSDGSAVLELDTGESVLAADVTRITSVENAGGQPASTTPGATNSNTVPNSATGTQAAVDKTGQDAKERDDGLLPWLSLDAAVHL